MNRYELMRYERGLTQREVANASGVSVGTLVNLEDGSTSRPSARVAAKLAEFYGLTVSELLGVDHEEAA